MAIFMSGSFISCHSSLQVIAKVAILLGFCLAAAAPAPARTVGVGLGAGNGFLFNHRGNCFAILPTHVHSPRVDEIRLSVPDGAVGRADILYSTDAETDLSLALVTGGIARNCAPEWMSLPRRLDNRLRPGMAATVVRNHQQSQEARQVVVGAVNTLTFSVVAGPGQPADFFAGTSGATVLDGQVPIGMVIDAETTSVVWALRMDEIVGRIARWIDGVQEGRVCDDPSLAEHVVQCHDETERLAGSGLPFRVTDWSAHPIEGANDPVSMAAGAGPYVAHLADGVPIWIEVQFPQTVALGRIVLRSEADGQLAFVPRSVRIMTDTTTGPVRRALNFISRDMPPDGVLDAVRRETYARRVTIEIWSTWGGGSPVRLDEMRFE